MSDVNAVPRILIVEDDDDTRRAMGMRLRASGFTTLEAIDVPSAVKTIGGEDPDLILLDLGLPGGGGERVLEELGRRTGAPIPVIVLSARSAESSADSTLRAGAFAYLEKLVDNETLLKTIRAGLDR